VRVCNQCALYRVNPFESTHAPRQSNPAEEEEQAANLSDPLGVNDVFPTTSAVN